ncbi:MAG: hypothetical protein U0930_01470 [Pirellulales bacterium]
MTRLLLKNPSDDDSKGPTSISQIAHIKLIALRSSQTEAELRQYSKTASQTQVV